MAEIEDEDRIEVLPVLPSLDISEALSFYRDQLGFGTLVHETHDYLILRRDGMELHFWLTEDRSLCERISVYLRGGGMAVRPWNMEEFYVHDPHGLLRFGRIPRDYRRG